MSLTGAKKAVVAALLRGEFESEVREALGEKNLLAIGDIKAEDVARLVLRTSKKNYTESQHSEDHSVVVHIFRPTVKKKRWYIKVYFLDEADGMATFINVHQTT